MLAGVFGTGIRIGANLLLIPLVLVKLSLSELALWWVFVALGNFGNLADFGFGSTIPRIYSYLMAGAEDFEAEGLREAKSGGQPNFPGVNRLNATVQSLYLKISLLAIAMLALGGTIFLLKPVAEATSPKLSTNDVKDVSRLVQQWSGPSNAVSAFLWGNFSQPEQSLLKNYQPSLEISNQAHVLVTQAINKIIEGPAIYTGERFKGIALRPETTKLLQQSPGGTNEAQLNRLLLEDAYPLELVRNPLSGHSIRVWCLWVAFFAAIGYNLATYHWALAVQGLNRMRELQVVYIWGGLSYAGCAALLLVWHAGLASMVAATFLRGFVMHGRCRQIFRRMVPEPEKPFAPDRHIVKKLWPNTCKFGIIALGNYCIANVNVLICSQMLGKEILASYGLTAQVGSYLMGFASLWLGVKWPVIAMLRTQARLVEMAVLFARRLALVMLSFVGMCLIVFFAGNFLLSLKGTHTRLLAPPYLALYLIYLTQGLFCSQFGMLALTENVVPFFKVVLCTGLGVIVGSLILTRLFGLWGLLAAPLVADLACNSWFTLRRGFQGQPLVPRQLALAALGGHP
jgi:O-antigen/teichoic acid export membrane protein